MNRASNLLHGYNGHQNTFQYITLLLYSDIFLLAYDTYSFEPTLVLVDKHRHSW